MKININNYLPSSKLVAMAVRFPKCDGTIWDTLLNWFPRLQDCNPLVFRHVLNLKVQEFLASHQKISWRNIWLGHLQISPLPEVQWAVKRRVKGCKHSQVDEKKSIEMGVGCATFWSQQQVQAPKRSICYRFFENKAIHGSWATFTLVHLEHLAFFLPQISFWRTQITVVL